VLGAWRARSGSGFDLDLFPRAGAGFGTVTSFSSSPGMQINVSDNTWTIRGEKKAEREQKDKDYHLVERSYGSFARTLELPAGANADDIKATISKGVLSVTVPTAPAQVKKIQIKAAA
jgi:hypothetical protein